MNAKQLKDILDLVEEEDLEKLEIRVGDVVERHELHCTVGSVYEVSGSLVISPGGDEVWKDETIATMNRATQLWPEEDN